MKIMHSSTVHISPTIQAQRIQKLRLIAQGTETKRNSNFTILTWCVKNIKQEGFIPRIWKDKGHRCGLYTHTSLKQKQQSSIIHLHSHGNCKKAFPTVKGQPFCTHVQFPLSVILIWKLPHPVLVKSIMQISIQRIQETILYIDK